MGMFLKRRLRGILEGTPVLPDINPALIIPHGERSSLWTESKAANIRRRGVGWGSADLLLSDALCLSAEYEG